MKAMILAAGLGTRLKPLTDKKPKALIEVGGVPMLERVITKLVSQGFNYIVVNIHHLGSQIIEFLSRKDFGARILISDERSSLLDTGGGIVKAFPLLFDGDDAPVLFHNVDILSNADLKDLIKNHGNSSKLIVSDRQSARKLIFDSQMNLRGWHDSKNQIYKPEGLKLSPEIKEYAFSGIYVLTKNSIEEMATLERREKFSVTDYFLNPERKEDMKGVVKSDLQLIDIGKPATLSQAELYIG